MSETTLRLQVVYNRLAQDVMATERGLLDDAIDYLTEGVDELGYRLCFPVLVTGRGILQCIALLCTSEDPRILALLRHN